MRYVGIDIACIGDSVTKFFQTMWWYNGEIIDIEDQLDDGDKYFIKFDDGEIEEWPEADLVSYVVKDVGIGEIG